MDGRGSLRLTGELRGGGAAGERAPTGRALIAAADAALYRAKRAGKNRVERAEPVHAERSTGRPTSPRASVGFRAMGVLDDAIREHLDLKRRHGVAEEEVHRQEEEALGPARREVAPADDDCRRRLNRPREARAAAGRRGTSPRELPVDEAVDADAPAADTPSPRASSPLRRRGAPAASRREELAATRKSSRREERAPTQDEEPHAAGRELSKRSDGDRRSRRGSRPARGHAGLPAGDAGARPALVRAEAAARLRLRLRRQLEPPRRGSRRGRRRRVAARAARPGDPRA